MAVIGKLNELLTECLVYKKQGQNITPIRVEQMIKEAYEAGKDEGANELLDFMDDPPLLK